MNIIEKIKEGFSSDKEEVLDIINIEDKYQIAKVKCDGKYTYYFPFIKGKRCFYNFGVENFETAMISVIAEYNKSSQDHISSCCKLLNVK